MKISYLTSYKRTSVNFRSSPLWDAAQHLQNLNLEDGTNMMSQNYHYRKTSQKDDNLNYNLTKA